MVESDDENPLAMDADAEAMRLDLQDDSSSDMHDAEDSDCESMRVSVASESANESMLEQLMDCAEPVHESMSVQGLLA